MSDTAERLSCAEAQQHFEDLLHRAVKRKERVVLTRRGRPVALVPIGDVEFLEAIENLLDTDEYRHANEEFERSGEAAIPWERIKAELGL